ncbi:MAG: hypothetical protein Q7S40_07035 [Opitutaceae bacterium]|nr:hypothetical protein [Opitutaceae bacterium]
MKKSTQLIGVLALAFLLSGCMGMMPMCGPMNHDKESKPAMTAPAAKPDESAATTSAAGHKH